MREDGAIKEGRWEKGGQWKEEERGREGGGKGDGRADELPGEPS